MMLTTLGKNIHPFATHIRLHLSQTKQPLHCVYKDSTYLLQPICAMPFKASRNSCEKILWVLCTLCCLSLTETSQGTKLNAHGHDASTKFHKTVLVNDKCGRRNYTTDLVQGNVECLVKLAYSIRYLDRHHGYSMGMYRRC